MLNYFWDYMGMPSCILDAPVFWVLKIWGILIPMCMTLPVAGVVRLLLFLLFHFIYFLYFLFVFYLFIFFFLQLAR